MKQHPSTVRKENIFTEWIARFLILLFIMAFLSLFFYKEALINLIVAVLRRQESSHGVFVPFLSAYFLWLRFDKIKGLKTEVSLLPGSALLLAGIFFYYLSSIISPLHSLSVLSFLFMSGAFILFLFGKKIFVETAFPLFFLATMIPLPPDVYNQIADWMRQVNTSAAVSVTKAFGVPLYREEFYIELPEVNLFVSDGCSGIRYLLSYFTFSLVYGFLFKQGIAARLLVVLGSIPLAVISGITRLSVIFLAAHYISPVMAGNRPHIILSWAVFLFWLLLAVGVDQYFSRDRDQKNTKIT